MTNNDQSAPDRYGLVGHPVAHSRSPLIHSVFARQTRQRLTYELFGTDVESTQFTALLPAQEREPFEFLGRRWLKVVDHDRELTELYGNWRVPDTSWDSMRDGRFLGREPWRNRPTRSI